MKKLLLTAVFALAMFSTSCIGPYNATRGLLAWNTRATDSKWWNGVIHAGLWIVPVYELAILGDVLIFNTIEFFGGNNPFNEPDPPVAASDM